MAPRKTVLAPLVLSLLVVARAWGEGEEVDVKARIEEFNKSIASRNESDRTAALHALGPVLDPKVSGILVGFLTRDTEAVRVAAAEALLGRVGDDVAIRGLSSALEPNKKMPEAQKAILKALGETDSEKALPAIHGMFKEFKGKVAVAAVEAANKIASPESIEPLMDVMRKGEQEIEKGKQTNAQAAPDDNVQAVFDPARKALGDITGGSETNYKGWKDWWKKTAPKAKYAAIWWCPATRKTFEIAPGAPKVCPHDGEANKKCGVFLKRKIVE